MSVPLTATARLSMDYVVANFTHRLNMYMAYNLVLGVPQMVDRDGITTILWTTGGQYVWDKVRACIDSTTPGAAAATLALFSRSGLIWNLVATATLTGVPSHAAGAQVAQQSTWSLRDTAFQRLRVVLLELRNVYTFHSDDGSNSDAAFQAVTDMLTGADANASAPYRWLKSRGDRFLAATGACAGLTFDLNDKLKRRRGLE